MIICDSKGTVSVNGTVPDVMSEFMVICENIRNNVVMKVFDGDPEKVNQEMIRIINEVNSSGEKRRKQFQEPKIIEFNKDGER